MPDNKTLWLTDEDGEVYYALPMSVSNWERNKAGYVYLKKCKNTEEKTNAKKED